MYMIVHERRIDVVDYVNTTYLHVTSISVSCSAVRKSLKNYAEQWKTAVFPNRIQIFIVYRHNDDDDGV